jgi:hypothetical protein
VGKLVGRVASVAVASTTPHCSQISSPGEIGFWQFGQTVTLLAGAGELAGVGAAAFTRTGSAPRDERTAPQFSQISSVGATG